MGLNLLYECACGGAFNCDMDIVRNLLDPRIGVVTHHGGGNLGDIWDHIDDMRKSYVNDLWEYKHLLFPQSIHYSNVSKTIEPSKIFASRDMTLCARDDPSYKILEQYFPDSPRMLVPDMAFMIGPLRRFEPVVDIYWLLRTDKESTLPQVKVEQLQELLPPSLKGKITMEYGDWEFEDVPDLRGTLSDRALLRFNDATHTLSRGRVVVSDRLHGHIICMLLDIPHVMLDNFYGKVRNYHAKFTSTLDNAYPASTQQEALDKALLLLGIDTNEP